jgi:hypothetical protein
MELRILLADPRYLIRKGLRDCLTHVQADFAT